MFILLAALIVGLAIGNDYGMSWDEDRNADVGTDALQTYLGSNAYFSDDSLADHGPAYFMLQSLSSTAISTVLPGWTLADGRHLTNYLTFLLGALCFYLLCLRWLKRGTAALLTALMVTQPVLLGNAFINQKDIPFVTFFLATLVTGLAASDRWHTKDEARGSSPHPGDEPHRGRFRTHLRADWEGLSSAVRVALGALAVVVLLLAMDLLATGVIHRYGQSLVVAAYDGRAPAAAQRLFALLASRAGETQLDLYLAKYDLYFGYLRLTLIPIMLLGYLMIVSQALPSVGRLWGFSREVFRQPALLASAVLLGLTICVRQVGGFVGVLVSLALFYRWRNRALFPLVVYWAISLVVTIATWPYLWPDPYTRLIGSLLLVADFPRHSTLFQGVKIASGSLPWTYFPTLAGLQLTESAVALFILGMVAAIWRLVKRKGELFLYSLLALWVAVPLVALIFFGMPVYGFRHLLFILPPLMLVAGIGLEELLARIKPFWIRGALCALVLLPGIVGIVQLHPYEYVYYNIFVGGVSGASGKYEIDRWCISYREAIEYVDAVAEPRAVVVVPRQVVQIVPFARPDLRLYTASRGVVDADYVLSCTWRDAGRWDTRRFEPVYQVRRGSAVLTEVWRHLPD
jgi:4-amino-4-deoxy-L-arabinose transferase-like glycosyltransferase